MASTAVVYERLAAAGLAVRRRDVATVAWLQSMSSGLISRALGRAGWIMVPISWPLHLVLIAFMRPMLVRHGRGTGAVQLGRSVRRHVRPLSVLATLPVTVVVWLALLIGGALVTPGRGWPSQVIPPVLLLVLVLVDLAGSFVVRACAIRGHGVGVSEAAEQARAVLVASLAAYPRGHGHGQRLLTEMNAVFDEVATPALLQSRTRELVPFYERCGYQLIDEQDVRMLRPPSLPAASTARGAAVGQAPPAAPSPALAGPLPAASASESSAPPLSSRRS